MMVPMWINWDWGTTVAAVLAVIIAVYLFYLDRREKRDKADAPTLCAVLSEDRLAELSDNELVAAVVANLLHKQDKQHPDLSLLLPLLSPGRRGVYSLWLICHELEQTDLEGYFKTPYRRFALFAAEGFTLVGAAACAEAMTAACDRYDRERDGEKELPPWAELTAALRQAIAGEQPLQLCIAYIRDNPAEFADS